MSVLGDRKLRLADRYEREEGGLYLSGLQALVRIPIDQHRLDQRRGRPHGHPDLRVRGVAARRV